MLPITIRNLIFGRKEKDKNQYGNVRSMDLIRYGSSYNEFVLLYRVWYHIGMITKQKEKLTTCYERERYVYGSVTAKQEESTGREEEKSK